MFYTPLMSDRSGPSFSEFLTADQRRMFYERHWSLAVVMILILFLAPFAGLYVTGLLGSMIGVGLSVAAYFLLPPLWLLFGR